MESETFYSRYLSTTILLIFLTSCLLIPLVFHPNTSHPIVYKEFLLLWLGGILTGLTIFQVLLEGERVFKIRPLLVLLGVYVLVSLARLGFSEYPWFSLKTWRPAMGGMLFFLPAMYLGSSPRNTDKVLRIQFIVLGVIVSYGVIQFLEYSLQDYADIEIRLDPVHWSWHLAPGINTMLTFLETDFRDYQWSRFPSIWPSSASTLGNPNFLAGYIVPFLPIGWCLCRLGKIKWKYSLWFIIIFLGLGIVITTSRGGLLGGLAGLYTFTLLMLFTQDGSGIQKQFRLGTFFLVLVPIGFLIVAFLFATYYQDRSIEDVFGALGNRVVIYRTSLRMIMDNWLLGVGTGHFTIHYPDYLTPSDASLFQWMESLEEKVVMHAHNEILEIWSETGLIGLSIFLAFHWILMRKVFRSLKDGKSKRDKILVSGFLAGIVSLWIVNLVSVDMRWATGSWLYWSMLGLLAGMVCRDTNYAPKITDSRGIRTLGVTLILGLSLIITLLIAPIIIADRLFFLAQKSDYPEAERYLKRALEYAPLKSEAHFLLAGYYFSIQDLDRASRHYQEIINIQGPVAVVSENLTTVDLSRALNEADPELREIGIATAIRRYREDLDRHPEYPRLHDYLSRAYHDAGLFQLESKERRKAIQLYEKWFKWRSSYPRPNYALDYSKNLFAEQEYEKSYQWLLNAYRWGGNRQRIDKVLQNLIRVDAQYEIRWKYDTERLSARQTLKRPSS